MRKESFNIEKILKDIKPLLFEPEPIKKAIKYIKTKL